MARTYNLSIAAIFLSFIVVSCAKNKDCFATIVCKDITGNGIDSVEVELYSYVKKAEGSGGGTGNLKVKGITDETGRISFAFNVPAMYTVRVMKGAQSANASVKLEEGKEVQKDITLP